MNLSKKKNLAAKTLKVGKDRILFVKPRIDEIKEAITKEDIRSLKSEGAIIIKEIKGVKKVKRRRSRSPGNIRKKINKRKKDYVIMTRKLRKQVSGERSQGKLSREESLEIRKKIRNRDFKSSAQLKKYIEGLKTKQKTKIKTPNQKIKPNRKRK